MPKDDALIIQVDLGNSDFNIIVIHPDGTQEEFIMPHDILFLEKAEWSRAQQRAKVQRSRVEKSQTFCIMVDNLLVPVMVGDEVRHSPDSHKKIGSNKYEYGYMDSILCAVLLEVLPSRKYPKGHDNIILGISYPTTEIDHLERLVNIVGGTHKIEDLHGNKRKFVVRLVVPTDEALGGLLQYKHTQGSYNPMDINEGEQLLWLDIGGSIGSMGVVTVNSKGNLVPLYREVRPINQGILKTLDTLADALMYYHPNEFRGMTIPADMLRKALLTQEVALYNSGDVLDVSEAVKSSCSIIDEIDRIYKNHFSAGRTAKGIVLTGGGIGSLFNLAQLVLNHTNAQPADRLETINFANVRGALWATLAALIEDGKLPANYEGVYYAT